MTDDHTRPPSRQPSHDDTEWTYNPNPIPPQQPWPPASREPFGADAETRPTFPTSGSDNRPGMPPGQPAPDWEPRPPSRPLAPPRTSGQPARPASRPAGAVKPRGSQKRKPRKNRRKRILLIALLAFLVLSGILGFGGYYGIYSAARSLATDGASHLQKAETFLKQLADTPLDTKIMTSARSEFSAAQNDFDGVNFRLSLVGPFLGLIGAVSGRSAEIQSYVHLARMASDLSTAGNEALGAGLTILNSEQDAFHSPGSAASAAGPGAQPATITRAQAANSLSASDIVGLQQTGSHVLSLVDDAWNQVQGVTLTALPPDLSVQSAITFFRSNYPGLRQTLLTIQGVLTALPQVFGVGHSTTYLTELLDTDEARPTGGFITAYGQMTIQNGQLGSLSLNDTYLLDAPYQANHSTPIPSNDSWFTLSNNWGLRDSNLEPDFPTAAKAAEQLYTAEGGSKVDGVAAFTSTFFTHVLSYTGPVQIPDLKITVSASNFLDELHQYQFQRATGDSVSLSQIAASNKQFPALFSKYFLAALRQLSPSATLAVLQEVALSVGPKDVQLYLNDAHAEQALTQADQAGAVAAPSGDALLVVDTSLSANKVSGYISQTEQDNIILDDQGNAIHHLTITYHWGDRGPTYGSSTYTDYLRIYVPPKSQIQGFSGFTTIDTATAYQRAVWSTSFHLVYGQKRQFTITYTVPNAAPQQSGQFHYNFLVQRQAGFPAPTLGLIISIPQDANVTQQSSTLSASLHLAPQALDHDTTLNVDYA